MRRPLPAILCVALTIILSACAPKVTQADGERPPGNEPGVGAVTQLDDRLEDLIRPGSRLEQLASGFDWSEGPVWVERDGGYLLFSDIPRNQIHKWSRAGGLELYLKPSGYTGAYSSSKEPGSNRLLLDRDGSLLLCQHGDRRIARMEAPLNAPAATFTTVVGDYEGGRLNSPNDAVLHPNGDIYFTDPPYGLPGQQNSTSKELEYNGVYRYRPSTGRLTLLTKELSRPNGIELSPDGRTLIVANSDRSDHKWMKYDLDTDGNILSGRVMRDVTGVPAPLSEGCDGMAMHSAGYLFATGPGGVHVFHPDETLLGIIRTGQKNGNCTLDSEQRNLYITADSLLLRLPLQGVAR